MASPKKKKSVPKKKTVAAKKPSPKAKKPKLAAAPVVEVPAAEDAPAVSAEILPSTSSAVILLGEDSLVAEYSDLFSSKGIEVSSSGTIAGNSAPVAFELTIVDLDQKKANLRKLDAELPPSTIILTNSVTVSATEQATWIEHRERLVGIGALPSLSTRPLLEIAPTIYSPAPAVEQVLTFLQRLEKQGEIVQDRVGLIFPRLICRLINEAAFALSEEIAAPQDLDAAIMMGLKHPRGPIAWVDRLGLVHVAAVLRALEQESGDPRYRTAPLLRQMALAGEWWKR